VAAQAGPIRRLKILDREDCGGSGTSPVPEPSTLFPSVGAALVILLRARRLVSR